MKKELQARYDATSVEEGKYQKWLDANCFKSGDSTRPPFCIVIPPPNVTGKLHLGHAWDGTLQDMIIRYKKMKGFDTLWLPGMDHAGIATQAKVEEKLRKIGISRHDIGREKFLDYAWGWKDEYASFIHQQWSKLGLSLDYDKERFTLDQNLSDAVKEVFVKLYRKGLIYQGERIINWDPKLQTALSNIEVIYQETESSMYYFKYYIDGNHDEFLTVATTRPETMFGDVCVVVNPKDSRYQSLIGKRVINPANGDSLPVIADAYVDIEFGTGAMKCTPAHDPNDFIIGERYGFAKPICMNPDGTMNELAHQYTGLDRFECRKQMVESLQQVELLINIEKRVNQVGYSERSHVIVEPYLSKQWFVKMKPLAEQSLSFQKDNEKVEFFPDRFEKIFTNWMEGIEDWCISRQLWWGHRIPAWYHKETGEIYVDYNPPKDSENYIQDEDVLDTWFSSALWPFSTLGWPHDTADLERYYPTDVLVTAYDIIFFWVSRMIFQALEFTGTKPFKHALIHGLIRDSEGRKMSKSLGNGVDPMDVISQYGTDALRFFLTTNSAPGLDLRYQEEKVDAAWNFINKIWNASRFVMMNLPEDFVYTGLPSDNLSYPDLWILDRLNHTIEVMNVNMDRYEFVIAGTELYNFIWDEFCSWYIEMSKLTLTTGNEAQQNATRNVLFYVLDAITKLIHPFMPFVSEEIYQTLHNDETMYLCFSSWPVIIESLDLSSSSLFETTISIIKTIRGMRNDNNLAPNKLIKAQLIVSNQSLRAKFEGIAPYVKRYGFIEELTINEKRIGDEKGMSYPLSGVELFFPLAGMLDIQEEIKRLLTEIEKLQAEIARCDAMLSNPRFVEKAPQKKLDEETNKRDDYKKRLAIAHKRHQELSSL